MLDGAARGTRQVFQRTDDLYAHADVALIRGGVPEVSAELSIAYGLPIHVPMVDVRTVGDLGELRPVEHRGGTGERGGGGRAVGHRGAAPRSSSRSSSASTTWHPGATSDGTSPPPSSIRPPAAMR